MTNEEINELKEFVNTYCPSIKFADTDNDEDLWWSFEPSTEGHVQYFDDRIYLPFDIIFYNNEFFAVDENGAIACGWEESIILDLCNPQSLARAKRILSKLNKRYKEILMQNKKDDIERDFE